MNRVTLALSFSLLVGCSTIAERSSPTNEPPLVDAAQEAAFPVPDYYCTPQGNLTPICGLMAPEDAEWLPDGSGLIVSEIPGFGSGIEGRISLIDLATGQISVLHDASRQTSDNDQNIWGAHGVTSKSIFSPHGISLSQREDGRWQLLVVNHAEKETIEFFELLKVDGEWQLKWRGGVEGDGVDFYNDVSASADGFYTTRFFKGELETLFVDYTQKLENGVVKKWSPETGWMELSGTKGVALNGILWNEAADELMVSEWGMGRVHAYTGAGNHKFTVTGIPNPDNISWNEDRDAYLVASKTASLERIAACGASGAEVCEGEFNIFEIEPLSGLKTTRHNSDGVFWGPPSNAVEKNGKLYLGSFGGTRLLIVSDPAEIEPNQRITVVAKGTVIPGKRGELIALSNELAEHTLATEDGALSYRWFVSEDGTEVTVVETYENSEAVLFHGANYAPFAERLDRVRTTTSIEFFGNVSEDLKAALDELGFPVQAPVAGFSRPNIGIED